MTAWKDWELDFCRMFGTERAGPQGKHGSDGNPDSTYALEAKRVKKYRLLAKDLAQAKRQSQQEGKPWILGLRAHNDRNPVAIVDCKWLSGKLRRLEELERALFPDKT